MEASEQNRPLRVGIAGLRFGADVHLPAFSMIPGIEVVALLGRDPEHAKVVGHRTRTPTMVDLTAWLDCGFDAVSVALPPDSVESVVGAALDRGIPVLCEKPLGHSEMAARALADRASNSITATDFEFAELETFIALRETLARDAIGPIRHVSVSWLTESWAQQNRNWSWKTDLSRGGGALTLFGTHLLYLAEWLFGPVSRVFARFDARTTARLRPTEQALAAEDLVHLILEHASGPVFSAVFGNANPGMFDHRWTVVGERGTAALHNASRDLATGFNLLIANRDGAVVHREREPAVEGDGRVPPFFRLASRFIDSVRSRERCRPDFRDGARVEYLASAVRKSAALGRWVELEE